MINPATVMTTSCPRCSSIVTATPDPVSGTVRCDACGTRFDPRAEATNAAAPDSDASIWQPAAGDHFSSYTLLSELGRGGMSTVWRARQDSLGRDVAVKILHAHLAADTNLRRRFAREAEAMVLLDHPNVVPVVDRGEHEGRPYLVTTLVGTRTLRDEIMHGIVPPQRVARLADEILAGLTHAHGKGLVHRDVKPENIIIDDEGSAHLADFGIAQVGRALDGHTLTQLTKTDVVLGTIAYMAPEQAAGSSNVDHRCDLYALGVVCYELLTGHLPQGRFEDPSEHLSDAPARQRAAWDQFILSCLERKPSKRPQDAQAARQLLHELTLLSSDFPNSEVQVAHARAAAADQTPASNLRHRYHFGPVVVAISREVPGEISAALAEAERAAHHSVAHARRSLHTLGIKLREGHASADADTDLAWQEVEREVARAHAALTPAPRGRTRQTALAEIDAEDEDTTPHGRHLYRDPYNSLLGGVLGGLAAWTGIHSTWLRLGAIFGPLIFPVGYIATFAAYIIAWIVISKCPDQRYRPRPLNASWPQRPSGWLLGVCALADRQTTIPAFVWRLLAIITVIFTWPIYLALGILLPAEKYQDRQPPAQAAQLPQTGEQVKKTLPPPYALRFWGMAGVVIAIWALLSQANNLPNHATMLWWIVGACGAAALLGGRREDQRPLSSTLGGLALGTATGGVTAIAAVASQGIDLSGAIPVFILVGGMLIILQVIALLWQRHAATGQILAGMASLIGASAPHFSGLSASTSSDAAALTILGALVAWSVTAAALFPLVTWLTRPRDPEAGTINLAGTMLALGSLGSLLVLMFGLMATLQDHSVAPINPPALVPMMAVLIAGCVIMIIDRRPLTRWMMGSVAFLGVILFVPAMTTATAKVAETEAQLSIGQQIDTLPDTLALEIIDSDGEQWTIPISTEFSREIRTNDTIQERGFAINHRQDHDYLGEVSVAGEIDYRVIPAQRNQLANISATITATVRHDNKTLGTIQNGQLDYTSNRMELQSRVPNWKVALLLSRSDEHPDDKDASELLESQPRATITSP